MASITICTANKISDERIKKAERLTSLYEEVAILERKIQEGKEASIRLKVVEEEIRQLTTGDIKKEIKELRDWVSTMVFDGKQDIMQKLYRIEEKC